MITSIINGITLSVVGSLLTSIGLCIQRVYLSNKNFVYTIGILFVVIGQICKMVNDGILPLSIVAPLSAQTVIYTKVLDVFFASEEISNMLIISVSVICFGILVSLFGGNVIDDDYNFSNLFHLFTRPNMLLLTFCCLIFLFLTRFIYYSLSTPKSYFGLFYRCFSAGIFSGWSGIVGKSVMEIFMYAIYTNTSQFFELGAWFLVLIIPFLSIPKFQLVNKGMQDFHHFLFLPLYQAVAIAINGAFGILYFDEFNNRRILGTGADLRIYLFGLLMTSAGVAMLSFKYSPLMHSTTAIPDAEGESGSLLCKDAYGDQLSPGLYHQTTCEAMVGESVIRHLFTATTALSPPGNPFDEDTSSVEANMKRCLAGYEKFGSSPSYPKSFLGKWDSPL